jgi:pimeloyl-ACP methyl ester carboxylesterase
VALLDGDLDGAVVISCHGMLSSKNGTKHELLAGLLAERGISTLRFDFAGRGESDGALFDLSYSNEMEDLSDVIDQLAARQVNRFGLFGSSMGGAVALMTAARDERVVALATLAAVAHPESVEDRYAAEVASWRERGWFETGEGRIGAGFIEDAAQHNLIASVRVLRAPILVLHGDNDEVVPCSDAHDIAAAARNVSLEIVMGADHRFSDPVHLRPAMARVADFLAGHLQ